MSFEHRHTFIYEIYDSDGEEFDFPNQTLTVSTDGDITLNDILDSFRGYLQGAGFIIHGDIREVPPEQMYVSNSVSITPDTEDTLKNMKGFKT